MNVNNINNENFKSEPAFLVTRDEKISNRPLAFLFAAFIFAIVLGFGIFYAERQIGSPLNIKAESRKFIVRSGESLKEIAKDLEEEGLIENKIYFIFYVWKNGFSNSLQAGVYSLSPAMSVSQIAQKLKNGEIIPRETAITIPEGFKISQIEERLKKAGLQSSISAARAKDFKVRFKFLKDAPQEASLEGFLFPDTYEFYPEATVQDIIRKMLDNFDKKFTEDSRGEILKQGKTFYEIITMASLIEKEVKTFEDRRIVSGIFWKRIKEQRPLESCATIAYALNVDKWRYSIEDTKTPSPYNTYLNLGLPPGPICNPGIESIKAAIFPKESLYNFFLTDPETHNTIFSQTLEEHNLNKAKYFK